MAALVCFTPIANRRVSDARVLISNLTDWVVLKEAKECSLVLGKIQVIEFVRYYSPFILSLLSTERAFLNIAPD